MVLYTGLARVAKRTGYPVVEVKGWKKRGYGQMVKAESVMCHHTAGPRTGNYPSLNVVTHGRPGITGPLTNYGIGRDGTIYVIAAGRANHAGRVAKTMWSNTRSIGIEAENTGTGETWSTAQLDAYVRLCAELCKEFKWPVTRDRVVGHKEAAVPRGRKIDPNFSTPSLSMNQFRAYVKAGSYKRSKPSTGTASTSKPKPKPSKPAGKKNARTDAWLKKHLPRITGGTSKNSVGHLVGLYQRQQISPYTLVHDQHWGKLTDQHYRWVHELQVELNRWKGTKIEITKTWDKQTRDRVIEWQKRNMGNAYKGTKADGVVGPLTTKPLGLKAYPN